MNRFSLAPAILIHSLSIGLASADTQPSIDFETISKGIDSQFTDIESSQLIEIYTHEQWLAFWKKHKSRPNYPYPLPSLPEIDFQNFYILVALDQLRGSGGYHIEINKVLVDPKNENKPIHIITTLGQPGRYTVTSAEINRPYHIIKISK